MDARLDPSLAPIPEHLRICGHLAYQTVNGSRVCNDPAVFSISCRHGAELPTCQAHAGEALLEAYKQDGDRGHVDVYHLKMYYVTHERSLGETKTKEEAAYQMRRGSYSRGEIS